MVRLGVAVVVAFVLVLLKVSFLGMVLWSGKFTVDRYSRNESAGNEGVYWRW